MYTKYHLIVLRNFKFNAQKLNPDVRSTYRYGLHYMPTSFSMVGAENVRWKEGKLRVGVQWQTMTQLQKHKQPWMSVKRYLGMMYFSLNTFYSTFINKLIWDKQWMSGYQIIYYLLAAMKKDPYQMMEVTICTGINTYQYCLYISLNFFTKEIFSFLSSSITLPTRTLVLSTFSFDGACVLDSLWFSSRWQNKEFLFLNQQYFIFSKQKFYCKTFISIVYRM